MAETTDEDYLLKLLMKKRIAPFSGDISFLIFDGRKDVFKNIQGYAFVFRR